MESKDIDMDAAGPDSGMVPAVANPAAPSQRCRIRSTGDAIQCMREIMQNLAFMHTFLLQLLGSPLPAPKTKPISKHDIGRLMNKLYKTIFNPMAGVYSAMNASGIMHPKHLTRSIHAKLLTCIAGTKTMAENALNALTLLKAGSLSLAAEAKASLRQEQQHWGQLFTTVKAMSRAIPMSAYGELPALHGPPLLEGPLDIAKNLPPHLTAHIRGYLAFAPKTKAELKEALDRWRYYRGPALREYGPIETWDTSNITDMSGLFQNNKFFNEDISAWNVSNVTDFSHMFEGAANFNQPIGSWDVSRATNMRAMFMGASAFNQSLARWDVGRVTSMAFMFASCSLFNQPLAAWNTANVTDMSSMFSHARTFNQPLEAWNVARVQSMKSMFDYALVFNQPLASWNVSSVTDMRSMFHMTDVFDQPLAAWNVSSVTDMSRMFASAKAFNQDLNDWNVANVREIWGIFSRNSAMTFPLDTWLTKLPTEEARDDFRDAQPQPPQRVSGEVKRQRVVNLASLSSDSDMSDGAIDLVSSDSEN